MQKLLFAKIELWLLILVVILGGVGLVGFGGIVLNVEQGGNRFGRIGKIAHSLAGTMDTIEIILKQRNSMAVILGNRFEGETGWSFPEGKTGTGLQGYWLMSRHIAAEKRTVIELVRLSDNAVMHTWNPDADALYAGAKPTALARAENWNNGRYRAFHPFLMENGDLVVKDSHAPLMRIDACARPVWMQDGAMFHHSTESDGAGGFWIPSVVEPSKLPFVTPQFNDEGLTHVAADGKILEQISVSEILIRHGMQATVFPPFARYDDPLHLNDIQPVLADGPHWKKGDLFISLRHPSMVLLYRPATDEIIWQRSGLWMAQHDVDILDDHRISVFDNRTFYRGSYGRPDGTSDIVIYDFATDTTSSPLKAALEREKVAALFEGLSEFLPGGDFIVEDHNTGRVLIFAADGRKLGQFVNRNPDGKVYQIGWGRYIEQGYGDDVLQKIVGNTCDA